MAVADVYLLCHINFTLTVFLKIVRKAEWVLKKVDLCSSGSFLCFQCMEKVRKINRSMSASGQTVCLVFFQTWLSIWALNFTAGASLPFMKYLELIEVHTVCCFSRVGSNCRNPLLWTMQWLLAAISDIGMLREDNTYGMPSHFYMHLKNR